MDRPMPPELVLPRESRLYQTLAEAVRDRRCVFFAGLPGVGKSLLIQQTALLATEAGRQIHLLQWDVARGAFETAPILARYPEVDGITHAAIRKAAGLWVRQAVHGWAQAYADPAHLLIGEAPLIGNRFSELAQQQPDGAEALLGGERSLFLIPAPSAELRASIEQARAREMATPLHERERANATVDVMQSLWRELGEVAARLGVPEARPGLGYDRDQYVSVYARLLCHRRVHVLDITQRFEVRSSPYDLLAVASELVPSTDDVDATMRLVDSLPPRELERQVARWHDV
jgi:hypothetical protein